MRSILQSTNLNFRILKLQIKLFKELLLQKSFKKKTKTFLFSVQIYS